MEQKFIDYVERYFELKYEHKLLQDEMLDLKNKYETLIYRTVSRTLGCANSLCSWDYEYLSVAGINKEKADEVVAIILEERKAEKESDEN